MRQRLPAVIAAAFVLLVSACGGGASTADFKKQFQPLDTQTKQIGDQLGTTLRGAGNQTDVQLAGSLQPLGQQLNDVVKRMGKITPPDKIKSDYNKLKDELSKVAADLTSLSSNVSSHNANASRAGAQQLVSDSGSVKPTANRIRQAVGLPQSP